MLKKVVVNSMLNSMTVEKLLSYANEYQIPLNQEQASKIIGEMAGKKLDIFNKQQRLEMIKRVSQITSPTVAKQVNELFNELVK